MSSYSLSLITPPASEPVSLSEIKAHLGINTTVADGILPDFIKAARELFEGSTGRAVLPTVYRQFVPDLSQDIYLMVGGVSAVSEVVYYDQDDNPQTFTNYQLDINTKPALVRPLSHPTVNSNRDLSAYVTFTAGWADAASVPSDVKIAIKFLAAGMYKNREGNEEKQLRRTTLGFMNICDKYQTGVNGPWRIV